jgi:hypothetical protein
MVRTLSHLYGEPFERNRAYSLVIGLMGGFLPARLAAVVGTTATHLVPGFNLFGLAVSSFTAAAYARRIGRMLIDHFERQAELERERLAAAPVPRWQKLWPIRLARTGRARARSALGHRIGRGWLKRQSEAG